jgi:hypothetical protein
MLRTFMSVAACLSLAKQLAKIQLAVNLRGSHA